MASFSGAIVNIGETTAYFDGYFTGGDSTYTGWRYVLLELSNGKSYTIKSSEQGGTESDFSGQITGLSSGTTYSWTATLGYVDSGSIVYTSYSDSGSFTTSSPPSVNKWSWEKSNGLASDAQTVTAYNILLGNTQITSENGFSYLVWNDLVHTISSVLSVKGLSWDGTYTTYAGARVSAGDRLSAEIYNSLLCNIKQFSSISRDYVNTGDRLTGSHIVDLTDAINSAI